MSAAPASSDKNDARAEHRRRLIGYGLAASGAALFSTKAVIVKLAYQENVGAEDLLALRMALAVPFFAVVGWIALRQKLRSGEPLPDMATVVGAALVGILGYWVASYTDFLGLVHISAQFERLILFTYPGFVVLFGVLFFAQPARLRAVLAFGISYVGLAVIFVSEAEKSGSNALLGAAFVLCSAIAFALYQLLAKGYIGRMGAGIFTSVAMIAAAVPVLLQTLFMQSWGDLVVSPKVFGYGFLLAIGATVLPAFFMNMALQRISAQANSTIATLSPVITIGLAALLLGETFGAIEAFGAALVLIGVGWFTLSDRKT